MNTLKPISGFTLVEVAIAMVILALLLAGSLSALRIQTRHSQFTQTQATLEEARSAVLAFAAAEGRLPCPSSPSQAGSANFGVESRDGTGQCVSARGVLPWKKLGLPGLDAWGHSLSYEVSPELARQGDKTLSMPGSVLIFGSAADASPIVDAQSVAFAIWSHGSNGREAFTAKGIQQATSSDEDEHHNAPNSVATPLRVILSPPSETFDDQGLWVSKYIFFKQLLDSGWKLAP